LFKKQKRDKRVHT